MSLALLPPELLLLTISYLRRADLKAWRLVDHFLSKVATSCLFREIHLSPNTSSFARAHKIAACQYLQIHIKGLTYHFGTLNGSFPDFEQFKHEHSTVRQTGGAGDDDEVAAEYSWCYHCWIEEINAQSNFAEKDEFSELCNLCTRLPRLCFINALLDECESPLKADCFISRRTGMVAQNNNYIRFASLFAAAANESLYKISARSLYWEDIECILDTQNDPRSIIPRYECLSRLKYLELGVVNDFNRQYHINTYKMLFSVQCLNDVLRQAGSLTTLKLDFDELPYDSHANIMLPISEAIFKQFWPGLEELGLRTICAQKDELFQFLLSHRKSLRKLYLGDIELVQSDGSERPPSILHLFQSIKHNLELRSCRLTGNFTNRVDQAWCVNTGYTQEGCLRDQLEHYLCGRMPQQSTYTYGDSNKQVQVKIQDLDWIAPQSQSQDQSFIRLVDESWRWNREWLTLIQIPETA